MVARILCLTWPCDPTEVNVMSKIFSVELECIVLPESEKKKHAFTFLNIYRSFLGFLYPFLHLSIVIWYHRSKCLCFNSSQSYTFSFYSLLPASYPNLFFLPSFHLIEYSLHSKHFYTSPSPYRLLCSVPSM